MALEDKVVISCALTGAVTSKRHCPAIPYTPAEIADEAKRAYDAGAAIVHVHARTDDGLPTWEVDTFRRIKQEIEARCPVLINWSTGGMGPMESRVQHVLQLRPHIAALNMGSMNYAKWRKDKKDFAFNFVFANPFQDIIAFAKAIAEAGAKPELECFDTGHTASAEVLAEAERLLRRIADQYFAANLTAKDVGRIAHSEDPDPLKAFGEACRRELKAIRAGL
jgi:uncharacterized protein (DUF849 family)